MTSQIPAGAELLDVRAVTRPRRVRTPHFVALGLGFLVLAFASSFLILKTDAGADASNLALTSGQAILGLRWQFGVLLVGCAALHYAAAGYSARTVMTTPAPWREVTLVQLAAAAANRVTPAGLGGSAVNARYFSKRCMPVPAAVGAVATLALLSSLANLLTGLLVVALGSFGDLGSVRRELAQLASYGSHLTRPLANGWSWLVAAILIGALGPVLIRRAGRWRGGLVAPVRELGRQPSRLFGLLGAAGATTLLSGCAFVCAVSMVPGAHASMSVGGLLIGYMLAAAVSSTVPVPAGLGSTEAALVAVLLTANIPATQAVQQVLVFRVITFWAPAVVGLLVSRRLHRRGVL